MSALGGRQLLSLLAGNFVPNGRFMDVSPDGTVVLATSNFIYLFDSNKGEYRGIYAAKFQPLAVKFCRPDWDRLLLAGEKFAQVLHLPTLSIVHKEKVDGIIKSADWSGQQGLIAVGLDCGLLRIWDLTRGRAEISHRFAKESISWVEFSPNPQDKQLLAVALPHRVIIFNVASQTEVRSLRVDCPQAISWSRDIDAGLMLDKSGVPVPFGRFLAVSCKSGAIPIFRSDGDRPVNHLNVKVPIGGKNDRLFTAVLWMDSCRLAISSNGLKNVSVVDLSQNGQNFVEGRSGHLKSVMGIAATKEHLISWGLDRQLIIWDPQSLAVQQKVPFTSFGEINCLEVVSDGSCVFYSISPPGNRGSGEIGAWRPNSLSKWYDHAFNWANLTSKMIWSLCVHPTLESAVIYGLGDGSYGVMSIRGVPGDRSADRSYKFPHIFEEGRPVYQIIMSPNPSFFWLLAEGKMFQQSVRNTQEPPRQIKLTSERELISRFELSTALNLMAVGYHTGVVELFCLDGVPKTLLSTIELPSTDNDIVLQLAFHRSRPLLAVATGSKDGCVYVYDVAEEMLSSTIKLSAAVKFDSHRKKVHSVSWSFGETAELAVAYGGAPPNAGVVVYNFDRKEVIGVYRGHQKRPKCVRFNPDIPDEVFSAGDDGFLLRWRVSDLNRNVTSPTSSSELVEADAEAVPAYTTVVETEDIEDGYGTGRTQLQVSPHSKEQTGQQHSFMASNDVRLQQHNYEAQAEVNFSEDETRRSNVAPRRNLISNEEFPLHSKVKTDNRWPSTTSRVVGANGVAPQQSAHYEVEKRESERYAPTKVNGSQADVEGIVDDTDILPVEETKKKGAAKRSLFDRLQKLETSKSAHLRDIEVLLNWDDRSSAESGQDELGTGEASHFGFYCDQTTALRAIQTEEKLATAQGLTNASVALSMWAGRQSETIIVAAEHNRLNDFLVSMAAGVSYEVYQFACLKYAAQLCAAGSVLKAATYLLAIGKVRKAVEMLVEKSFFRDAVMLCRSRLGSEDPLLRSVLGQWADRSQKVGEFEQAAKILIASGDLIGAYKALLKRGKDVTTLNKALLVALKSGDAELVTRCGQELIIEALRTFQWPQAMEVVGKHDCFKPWHFIILCHKVLVMCLCPLFVHIQTDTPVDLGSFSAEVQLLKGDDFLTRIFQNWVKNLGEILPTTKDEVAKVVGLFDILLVETAGASLLDKLPLVAANATAALLYAAVDGEKCLSHISRMLTALKTNPDASEIVSVAVAEAVSGPFAGIAENVQQLLAVANNKVEK